MMNKSIILLSVIILLSCSKYERVNPLDPYYNASSDEGAVLEYSSHTLEKRPDEPSNYVFYLYVTVKNTGNETVGSASNPVSCDLNFDDSNVSIAFGTSKEIGGSSTGYELASDQTLETSFPFTIRIPNSLSGQYNATASISLNGVWSDTFDVSFSL